MEDRCSKLKCRTNAGLEDLQQLVSVSSKSLESDQDSEFRCCSLGDIVHVGLPAEVAGEGDAQQPSLIDNLKGLAIWKAELV